MNKSVLKAILSKDNNHDKKDIHQSILNVAHQYWQEECVTYEETLNYMQSHYFGSDLFVMLAKYNYQTENGGHYQYYDNGFASSEKNQNPFHGEYDNINIHERMLDVIKNHELSQTDIGRQVIEIMNKFSSAFGIVDKSSYWHDADNGNDDGYITQECDDTWRSLDDKYYKINEAWMAAIEQYLQCSLK